MKATNHANKSAFLVTLLLAGLALCSPSWAADSYTITDLGTLGGWVSYAAGINNKGQVVGLSQTASNDYHAFFYSNGVMTDLGVVGTSSGALDINNNGQVVGYTGDNPRHAFLYSAGSIQNLNVLISPDSGWVLNYAWGINDLGQIVGSGITSGQKHAFLYSPPLIPDSYGTITDLGTFGGAESEALAINNNGQVVGNAWTMDTYPVHAFLYPDTNGQKIDLNPEGSQYSYAADINNIGQVVGDFRVADPSDPADHAFLYSNGILTDLSNPGQGWSQAHGINDLGQVVGTAQILGNSAPYHAFLYNGGSMLDLNNLLPSNSGWELQTAYSINDYGQIVGFGSINGGQSHAFLMTPSAVTAVTVLYPNGGETWNNGETQTIRWDAPTTAVYFDVFYSTNNGGSYTLLASKTTKKSWDWTPKLSDNGYQCRVKVIGFKADKKARVGEDASDVSFSIEVVKITTPNGGDILKSGVTVPIAWETQATFYNKLPYPVTKTALFYSLDGISYKTIINNLSGNPGNYPWKVPTVTSIKTKCTVKIILYNSAGKVLGTDYSDNYFTINR